MADAKTDPRDSVSGAELSGMTAPGWTGGQIFTLSTVEALLAHVNVNAAQPLPREGETVVDYWIRVIKYQAWDACFEWSSDMFPSPVDYFNPFGETK